MDLLQPRLKIKCQKKSFTLGPSSWNHFAYFRLFMHNKNQNTTICFDETFIPFLDFLHHEEMHTYEEIIALREQLLILGLDSTCTMATRAGILIAKGIHSISTQSVIWDIIQLGWNEFIPESGSIFTYAFIRQNCIIRMLLIALLPLKGHTIDILNTEVLEFIKNHEDVDLSDREREVKKLIQQLFEKNKTYSMHSSLFTNEWGS